MNIMHTLIQSLYVRRRLNVVSVDDLCRLYHVTSGSGIPVTLHVRDTVSPSLTVTSSLEYWPITDAGTVNSTA